MDLNKELKQAGFKVTSARVNILNILKRRSCHLSADDIRNILLDKQINIGLATIYRVLNEFTDKGLVLRHCFGASSVYEIDRGAHHDHMVCVETGKIIEFENEEIEILQRNIAEKHGYELVDHTLILNVRTQGVK